MNPNIHSMPPAKLPVSAKLFIGALIAAFLISIGVILYATSEADAADGKAIFTGGEKGAYHSLFCPPLPDALGKAYFTGYRCTPSNGTLDNIEQVLANPTAIGFAQLDVFARETAKRPDLAARLVVIRELACEGLWMVTRNDRINNYGDALGFARRIPFVLPPEASGAAATFDYLRELDPSGIGIARNISHVASATEVLRTVSVGSYGEIGIFVQFADPRNDNIKFIVENKLKVIPIVSREIVGAKVGDRPVYQVQEFSLTEDGFFVSGEKRITACTPVVIITGNPDAFSDAGDRADQTDLVKVVREIPADALLPKEGLLAKLVKGAKRLSETAVNELVAGVDLARKTVEAQFQ